MLDISQFVMTVYDNRLGHTRAGEYVFLSIDEFTIDAPLEPSATMYRYTADRGLEKDTFLAFATSSYFTTLTRRHGWLNVINSQNTLISKSDLRSFNDEVSCMREVLPDGMEVIESDGIARIPDKQWKGYWNRIGIRFADESGLSMFMMMFDGRLQ